MVYFPSTSSLGLAVSLGSLLLWMAHTITLAGALPSPQVPPLHDTSILRPPSPVLGDDDEVRWLPRAVDTAEAINGSDPFGSTTNNMTGGPTNVPMGWVDPRLRGGRMLDVGPPATERRRQRTFANATFCIIVIFQFVLPRKGEPLNVIISGLSDPYVLTRKGLLKWAQYVCTIPI